MKKMLTDGENILFCNLVGKPIRNAVHDESVVGIHQDKITGDVILGQPQPVTAVDQSFSIRGVTQLPEDDDVIAVKDPIIKNIPLAILMVMDYRAI